MSTTTPAVEAPAVEVEAVEVEAKPEPKLHLASDLHAEVAQAITEVTPLLTLAGMNPVFGIEERGDRQRMVTSYGRNSYFAETPARKEDGTPELAAPVKVALLRQVARQQGKALRHLKANGIPVPAAEVVEEAVEEAVVEPVVEATVEPAEDTTAKPAAKRNRKPAAKKEDATA